jgi:cystathionine beta-lyase/cystathionine gamma-synthase
MKNYDIATRTIHAGQEPDPSTGAIMTPIYATSTYVQESPGKHKGYDYSRSINPTRLAYEKCVADLESGTRGWAFASGLAATATALEALDSGSHVVVSDDLYGGTFRLFEKVRRRSANLDFTFTDLTDASKFEKSIKRNTRMVWIETPSNPLLKIIDIEAIAKIAREKKIISVSDNTFATPWIQRPIESGFDMVIHSATKYLNGHSDMVGGVSTKLSRRYRGTVRQFSGAARVENAGAANGTALLKRTGNRALAGGTRAGKIGPLSRTENTSAARSRAPANARVWRDRHDYFKNRPRRNAALS